MELNKFSSDEIQMAEEKKKKLKTRKMQIKLL